MKNDKVAAALEGSIEKWQKIIEGTGVDKGDDNCPLCQLFLKGRNDNVYNACLGCPVSEKTDASHCFFTPYEKWYIHMKFEHFKDLDKNGVFILCSKCKRIAQNEKRFLEGLRDEKNTNRERDKNAK